MFMCFNSFYFEEQTNKRVNKSICIFENGHVVESKKRKKQSLHENEKE
jgi:hypothetical protein